MTNDLMTDNMGNYGYISKNFNKSLPLSVFLQQILPMGKYGCCSKFVFYFIPNPNWKFFYLISEKFFFTKS